MTTDTLRQVFGTLRTPNGSAFPNKSLKWFRERRATVAQGSSVVLDEPFIVATDAVGEIDIDVMAGAYLVMAPLSDADRYFRVVVPDQAGPFDISSLIDGPAVEPDNLTQFEALVAKAKAWANAPEDSVVESGEFSAKHYAAKAQEERLGAQTAVDSAVASALAKAEGWAENPENVAVEPGLFSAKHWATKAAAERNGSETARTASEAARDLAQAARDAAVLGAAGLYADTAAGLAATSSGDYFLVPALAADGALDLYLNDTGGAVLQKTYPSTEYLISVLQDLEVLKTDLAQNGLLIYTGSGPIYPLVTSQEGNVILGWDDTDKKIVGFGIHDEAAIQEFAAQSVARRGLVGYTGSGPLWPIVTDKDGTVLLGYDETSGAFVGPGLSDPAITTGVATAQDEPPPLAAELVPVTDDKNHMIFYGQSLSVGAAAGSVLSVSQPYSNITFQGGPRAYDGSAYSWGPFKALVEDEVSPAPDGGTNRKETCCSGAANYATTLAALDGIDPATHVILASTAGHGGYRIDQLESGTAWWAVFQDHISEAYALDANYACHALCWLQGENDIAVSNFTTYRAKLEALQVDAETYVKSVNGQTGPVFLLTYQLSWGVTSSAHVAEAQLDLAQKNDKVFLVTPTYHLPFAGDNVHLTAVGYKWIGAYFGRAYKALVHDNTQPRWLNPVSATRRGAVIRVRFDVPYRPLRLDSDTLAATTDFGFRVTDGGVTASIASVQVDGDDVVITLSATPSGAIEVRYGLDYRGSGLTMTNGASGNLRDSNPETITISGTEYPLYNVAPHFRLTAIALGE